jgi:hypothetical protein
MRLQNKLEKSLLYHGFIKFLKEKELMFMFKFIVGMFVGGFIVHYNPDILQDTLVIVFELLNEKRD